MPLFRCDSGVLFMPPEEPYGRLRLRGVFLASTRTLGCLGLRGVLFALVGLGLRGVFLASTRTLGRLGLRGVLLASTRTLGRLGLRGVLLASRRTLGRLGLRGVLLASRRTLGCLGLRSVLLASRRKLGRLGLRGVLLASTRTLGRLQLRSVQTCHCCRLDPKCGALLQSLQQRGAQLRMLPTDRRRGYFAMQLDELGHREVNVCVQNLLQLVLPTI